MLCLPVWLLVLAGLISAIMSSVDSTLNSSSTLVVVDFIQPKNPNLSAKQILNYGRISTFVLMIIAAVWAQWSRILVGFGSIYNRCTPFCSSHCCSLFSRGLLSSRKWAGAFMTLALGTLLGIAFFVFQQMGWWTVHFTITAGIVVGLSTSFSLHSVKPLLHQHKRLSSDLHLKSVDKSREWSLLGTKTISTGPYFCSSSYWACFLF